MPGAPSRKAVLLATATIDPKGMPNTSRADPAVRMNDYRWALGKWLRASDLPIVVCENSGADLAPLRAVADAHGGDRVEFLSFEAPDFPRHHGKGYGEILILDHALTHSRLITPDTLVLKATGRLFVANYGRLWRTLGAAEFDVSNGWFYDDLAFADTRFFAATPAFIRDRLVAKRDALDEREDSKVYLEHLMAKGVLAHVLAGGRYKAMPARLELRGKSGTGNASVAPWFETPLGKKYRRLMTILRAGR